jgi:hypothetical protein
MKLSEMIKKLQAIYDEKGDLRVTIFDHYTANEGSYDKNEELWCDCKPVLDMVEDDDENEIEEVVLIQ